MRKSFSLVEVLISLLLLMLTSMWAIPIFINGVKVLKDISEKTQYIKISKEDQYSISNYKDFIYSDIFYIENNIVYNETHFVDINNLYSFTISPKFGPIDLLSPVHLSIEQYSDRYDKKDYQIIEISNSDFNIINPCLIEIYRFPVNIDYKKYHNYVNLSYKINSNFLRHSAGLSNNCSTLLPFKRMESPFFWCVSNESFNSEKIDGIYIDESGEFMYSTGPLKSDATLWYSFEIDGDIVCSRKIFCDSISDAVTRDSYGYINELLNGSIKEINYNNKIFYNNIVPININLIYQSYCGIIRNIYSKILVCR
jgi:hypothetical protein